MPINYKSMNMTSPNGNVINPIFNGTDEPLTPDRPTLPRITMAPLRISHVSVVYDASLFYYEDTDTTDEDEDEPVTPNRPTVLASTNAPIHSIEPMTPYHPTVPASTNAPAQLNENSNVFQIIDNIFIYNDEEDDYRPVKRLFNM